MNEVAWISSDERSTACCSVSSIIEPRLRWKSMIHSPFANAGLTLWSASAAGDLVDDVEADPDRELEGEMRPAARQAAPCGSE